METVKFNCHGHNAPAYGCNKPGDQSGEYVKAREHDQLLQERAAMTELLTDFANALFEVDENGRFVGGALADRANLLLGIK